MIFYFKFFQPSSRGTITIYDAFKKPIYLVSIMQNQANQQQLDLYDLKNKPLAKVLQKKLNQRYVIQVSQQKPVYLTRLLSFTKEFAYLSQYKWFMTGDIRQGRYQVRTFKTIIFTQHQVMTPSGELTKITIKNQQDAKMALLVALILQRLAKTTGKNKKMTTNRYKIMTKS